MMGRVAKGGEDAAGGREAALLRRLAGEGDALLLDGATGTELERAGLATGLPLWSSHALLEAPEGVGAVHAAHLAAGAEVVTANTFRTQRRTLALAGLGDRDASLTRLAVSLARHAVDGRTRDDARPAWVAGSLPPLEDCYRPDRVPDDAALAREHGRQAELLGEAGVDLILVETMNCLREALAAATAASRTGLPFVVSFVAWDGPRLLSGESLADAARAAMQAGAAAVGVNCLPPENLEACRVALVATGVPLVVSPNLGEPDPETGFARDADRAPAHFVAALEPWLDRTPRLVGGCCGTTPAHIRALRARLGG
ncbi:MAG: homocysteine S-methyltransferase family protein [Myxococcota bacterium]